MTMMLGLNPGLLQFGAGEEATLAGEYVVSGADGVSLSIGAAPTGSERRFVVVVATLRGPASITAPTIGGVSATIVAQVVDTTSTDSLTAIFYAEIPTGTAVTIDSDPATAPVDDRVHVYRLITTAGAGISVLDSAIDNTDGLTHTLDVDTADGGFVVGGATNINGGSHTWSGLTEDDDTDSASNDFLSGASASIVSGETPRSISVIRALSTSGSSSASASFGLAA